MRIHKALAVCVLLAVVACRTDSDGKDAPGAKLTPKVGAQDGAVAGTGASATTGNPTAAETPNPAMQDPAAPVSPAAKACLAAVLPTVSDGAFAICLGELIRIKSVNPPGDETAAAQFFADVFTALGIPARVFDVPNLDPRNLATTRRSNVLASLTPTGAGPGGPSVVLLNHLDTVDFHAEQWTKAQPLSGAVVDGMLYGRGALDMKNLGVLQMLAMAQIKLDGLPFTKAIHFLGVADEESAGSGALGALAEIRAGGSLAPLLGAEVVLNEGGFGLKDAIGDGSQLHVVATEERGGAWMRLKSAALADLTVAIGWLGILPDRGTALGDQRAKLRKWRESWGCELKNFATPNASYNVVPSLVAMTLSCRNQPSDADWEWIFDYDPAFVMKEQAATWKVAYDGALVQVTVSSDSTAHSSASAQPSALDVAVWGLRRLGALGAAKAHPRPAFMDYVLTPATKLFLDAVGRNHKFGGAIVPHPEELSAWVEFFPARLEQRLLKTIGGKAGIEKALRTSCSWTALSYEAGAAEAVLDCRLINLRPLRPGAPTHFDEFAETVRAHAAKNGVKGVSYAVEVGWNFTQSPSEAPSFQRIKAVLEKVWPGSEATAFMNPGGTDSTYFRDPSAVTTTGLKGVPAYGVTPAMVIPDVLRTFHGSDERFPMDQAALATTAYRDIVTALANP